MKLASEVFVSLYTAGIRLRREGVRLVFSVTGDRATADQIAAMKEHKTALLDIVDGKVDVVVGGADGARCLNAPDERILCVNLARDRGFPPLQLSTTVIKFGKESWEKVAADAPLDVVADAVLRLDDLPVMEGEDL
jgi:hypothetical protein